MRVRNIPPAATVLLLLLLVASLGCSGGSPDDGFKPDPNAGKSADQRSQDLVKSINDNPNMPADAKQKALAAIGGAGHPHRN